MAYDKLVDSAQLDGALTATADAIRAKTSDTAPISWDADDGFAAAVEGIADSAGTITDGIIVKARDADGWATEVDLYCADGKIPNRLFVNGNPYNTYGDFNPFYKLTRVNHKTPVTDVGDYAFAWLASFSETDIDFPALTSIGVNAFRGCAALHKDITLNCDDTKLGADPFNASGITGFYAPNFSKALNAMCKDCSSLKTVRLPKAVTVGMYTGCVFMNCTALEIAEFGSIGHPVTGKSNDSPFSGCTQTGLTITAYVRGNFADALLANFRDGATNATIILKAAEDTTYNDTQFAAGDTIITSTVAITNLLDTIGYAENTRISTTDGGNRTATGVATFGSAATLDKMIELSAGDVLRIKGVSFPAASDGVCCIAVYNDAATCTWAAYLHKGLTSYGEHFVVQFGEQITTITVPSGAATQRIRFTGLCTDPTSVVITKNQEI